MRDLREERKAIITVSEGWLLYRPDSSLTNLESGPAGTEPAPTPDPITVGPDGRLTTKNIKGSSPYSRTDCDADRQHLASIDDEQYFREITDEANRGNASFYSVDPRGLTALMRRLVRHAAPNGGRPCQPAQPHGVTARACRSDRRHRGARQQRSGYGFEADS